MDKLIFDDWLLRSEKVYNSRCKEYKFVFVFVLIALTLSLVLTIIYWHPVVFLLLFLLSLIAGVFEWLKIKNNHLRIYEGVICITDRFGREKSYTVDYKSCTLVLKKSANRSGGIWLLFYDKEQKLICKYEDMINHASYYGAVPTDWEQAVMDLQIKIVDEGCILKNR